MNNTKQNNNNTENKNSLSEERQDVTCSEGEAVTELSPSSGSPSSVPTNHDELCEYLADMKNELNECVKRFDGIVDKISKNPEYLSRF